MYHLSIRRILTIFKRMFVATLQHLGWVTKFIIEHKLKAGI